MKEYRDRLFSHLYITMLLLHFNHAKSKSSYNILYDSKVSNNFDFWIEYKIK